MDGVMLWRSVSMLPSADQRVLMPGDDASGMVAGKPRGHPADALTIRFAPTVG